MSHVQEHSPRDSVLKKEYDEAPKKSQSQAVANAVAEKAQFESLIKGFSALCVAVCSRDFSFEMCSDGRHLPG
jgi:hypothetical protein